MNGIFCLEGMWNDDLKHKSTVQPILHMLEVNGGVEYIHHDVATVAELEFYLGKWRQARYDDYPILYLAFHGQNEALLIGKHQYTLDRLSSILHDACKNTIVILAACSTLNTELSTIRRFLRNTGALAIGGYRSKVSWMLAASFEMLVLSALQQTNFSGRGLSSIERKVRDYRKLFNELDFAMVTKKALWQKVS